MPLWPAARLYGYGRDSARRAAAEGRLPAVRVGRVWRLRSADVLALIDRTRNRRVSTATGTRAAP